MDANRISSIDVMKDGIAEGMYEITGILPTGELTIALLSDYEKEYLGKVAISTSPLKHKQKCVQALMNIMGRPARELLQVYKQFTCSENERSKKNGLRLRNEITALEVPVQKQLSVEKIVDEINQLRSKLGREHHK